MSDLPNNDPEREEFLKEWNREFTFEEILQCNVDLYREQGMSPREIKERTTALVDYATGKETTFYDCKQKYGEEIAKDLLSDKLGKKELQPEVIQQIEDIHRSSLASKKNLNKEIPPKSKNKIKSGNGSPQFVPLPFELIDNEEFRHFFKGQFLTYTFLRRFIIRKKIQSDHLNLYENFFMKGKLASSCSIDFLAERFGCAPNTIRKHVEELEDKGCFKVVKVPSNKAWDGKKHHIYVFGTHDGKNNAKYYIDDVFGLPAVPKGQQVQ